MRVAGQIRQRKLLKVDAGQVKQDGISVAFLKVGKFAVLKEKII